MQKLFLIIAIVAFTYGNSYASLAFELSPAEILNSTAFNSGTKRLLMPASATAHVPSFGTANSTNIARNMIARVGSAWGIATVGLVAVAGYAAWVDSHPNDYPISYALLHPNRYPDLSNFYDIGDHFNIAGQGYRVNYVNIINNGNGCVGFPMNNNACGSGYIFIDPPVNEIIRIGTGSCTSGCTMNYAEYGVVKENYPPPALTPEEFADELAPFGNVNPSTNPEIDDYIKNHPDAVSFPPDLGQQISDAEDDINPSDQVDTDGDGISDSADPDIDGDGIPNSEDPDADGDGVPDADVPPEDEIEITNPDIPALHSVDLSPLLTIGSVVSGKFPFSLLSTVSAMASSLVSSPVAPVFTIHFPSPFDYDWIISLERWDSWASLLRFLVGSAFLVAVSMAILRRWV